MVSRSGMEQDYWWPGACDVIKDFGIIARDFLHEVIVGKKLHAYGNQLKQSSSTTNRPTSCFKTLALFENHDENAGGG